MNPTLAGRVASCWVCREVTAVEHVTALLYDADGELRRRGRGVAIKDAIAYLRSIGFVATDFTFRKRLARHVAHVERKPFVPVETGQVTPITAPLAWFDIHHQGMEVGLDALRIIERRLESMDDSALIAVAKMGQAAATERGRFEAKGRSLSQVDALLRLAAGMKPSGG